MNKQPIEFPHFPSDPESVRLLGALKELSLCVIASTPSDHLRACGAYLYMLSDAPYKNDYVYFRLHQELMDDVQKISSYYNVYIHSRGMDYMLDLINKEIGDFAPFFNEFQMIMYGINERSKSDPSYEPLNALIWGFYCALYDSNHLKRFLARSIEVIENLQKENRQSMYN